jgi:acetyl-CoA acetyltransferase
MIKFGRFPEKSVPQLGSEAALLALDDCGLTIQDMQALYCGNLGQASGMVGQRILQEIGQTGIPVVNVANACATGATAFREAWASVKADLYDVVLAVGVDGHGVRIALVRQLAHAGHHRRPLATIASPLEQGDPGMCGNEYTQAR